MQDFFANVELWLAGLGVWAYVVAPLVMAGVAVLPIPAEAPAMANGVLFGPVVGSLITWSGALLGAVVSYEIARGAGRPLAARYPGPEVVARIDGAVERAGWWGLLGLRFVPLVAFTALNWGAGLCGVPRWRFLWTTAVGIVPGSIVFTTSGAGIGALWRVSPPLTAALLVGVAAAAIIWSLRRRAGTVG